MSVLKQYLEMFDIKPSSVLSWCEKGAYSTTGMENNLSNHGCG